ncbi:hypothetical protein HBHAL_4517 [Halobacillus halophilus DSM 2266]|uniref:Yip1 domain-containing protein n=1 Tax=Halobacillus halophilus (strain ATCC 35676 / DSM 2266 / JCM 20832 / KCTC 3685 / LMG 17431 / NBRC 102448 / NCIMB 2269) TaxID=866895 RepID=I0JRT6_HALH3|nr:hypothetical protein [Halobacillus halophilus]CCG46857.1 hypothetical protein HBHAL_4517 [Halobacillus halophilus DSM 2266]
MLCPSCHCEQAAGNFCSVCGSSFRESETYDDAIYEVIPVAESYAPAESALLTRVSRNADEPNRLSGYTDYFQRIIKNPSQALASDHDHFYYGMLSVGIYMATFALSFYFLANKIYTAMLGGLSTLFSEQGSQQALPFINFTSSIFFFVLLFVGSAVVCMYTANLLMGKGMSFKRLIAQYGSVVLPFSCLNLIAIVFGLAGYTTLTLFTAGLSLFFTISILPALFIYHHGLHRTASTRSFYWSIGTSAVSMIVSYLIVRTFVLEFLTQIVNVGNSL